jgi:predicted DsbA family dithiol-disulfide isomerase
MAAGSGHITEASPTFVISDEVLRSSVCQWCSFLKNNLQVYLNEIKSMSEIIKILKEELKYDSAIKRKWMSDSACEGKPKINLNQCSNCLQLENQLKEALKELSSVKLIMDI